MYCYESGLDNTGIITTVCLGMTNSPRRSRDSLPSTAGLTPGLQVGFGLQVSFFLCQSLAVPSGESSNYLHNPKGQVILK